MIRTTVTSLRAAATIAARAITHKNTIPVLGHFLLEAGPAGATLTGTDMEQLITAPIAPVVVEVAHGRLTLRAKPVLEALRVLPPDGEVTIEAGELHAVLRAGSLTMRLATLPPDDFPQPKVVEGWPASFSMPAGELLRILAAAAYAVSTEETRYYLNGVYLHAKDGQLCAVATDGHRMMLARADLPEGAEKLAEIVPRNTVKTLRGMLRGLPADAAVQVCAGHTRLMVNAPSWRVVSKAIDGTFPDYGRVLPALDDAAIKLVIDRPAELLDAIRQVRAVSEERSCPLVFGAEGEALTLTVRYAGGGDEAQVTVATTTARWPGKAPEWRVGVQARYLRSVAQAFPSGVSMQFGQDSHPIRADGKEGVAVLMPMRV